MPNDKASRAKQAGPCCMVIFGGAGDLTKRLVVPSLYNLACSDLLPEGFAIVGFDMADLAEDAWKKNLTEMVEQFVKASDANAQVNQEKWKWLTEHMFYVQGDLTNPESYQKLKTKLGEVDANEHTGGNYLFYLAVADRFFGSTVEQIGKAGLAVEAKGVWRRVVIEKPFGHDLASAQALNKQILGVLAEPQIYRIDHFLGKETVQNLLMFRFANGMFEPIWNRDRVDSVQITVAETVGVEQRGGFYEKTGAMRDMIPNHVFQLLAFTAMEAPNSLSADAVRSEKAKVVEAIRPFGPEDIPICAVRGQYDQGAIGDKPAVAYRQEQNVSPESVVETYVAMKLCLDNWRWQGVPFYIRTGKRLNVRKTQIAIRFKETPVMLLKDTSLAPNWLLIRVQPDEGISLEFGAKIPGPNMKLGRVKMDFKYGDYFGTSPSTGYETLIFDVMIGDATLFQRADNIEGAWATVQPVLDFWATNPAKNFPNYIAGSYGPAAADAMLQRDGRSWRAIT
jgi:glucose-6-phosphate 1-dehydrogenase